MLTDLQLEQLIGETEVDPEMNTTKRGNNNDKHFYFCVMTLTRDSSEQNALINTYNFITDKGSKALKLFYEKANQLPLNERKDPSTANTQYRILRGDTIEDLRKEIKETIQNIIDNNDNYYSHIDL